MKFNKREKVILILGATGVLILLASTSISVYNSLQPDIVVDPNITDSFRSTLELELSDKNQKIIENPNNIDYRIEAGLIEERLGKLSAAERRFKQALKINNRDYLTYMYLGILYDKMEQIEKANEMLRIATQLEPRDARPFQALITLYKQHYPDRADELDKIFRAASDFTDSPEIWAEYARFLEDRREYRQSWIFWQEVVRVEPENEEAAANVQRLARQLGIQE